MESNLPKISVVTPSCQQARFLEECIRSVLSQEYPKLEYIIVDGGSSDGSIEIIKRYEGEIAYWVSEPDRGQAHAINKGLMRATGDVVTWLNSDDFYLEGAIWKAADAYLACPQASFYYGNGYRVDEFGRKKGSFFPKGTVHFNKEALIYGLNYILQPAAFINARSLVRAGYLDEKLHYGLDTDLWIRLANEAEPQPMPALIAASREHEVTKTSRGLFQRIEELRQIAEKYSGDPMTPGVLLYFLDTLHRFVGLKEARFPADFQVDIEQFWSRAANILLHFGVGPDGIPLSTIGESRK